MRAIFITMALAVSVALINFSWAGQDAKQDKKAKAKDVGKGLELKGNLDNSLNMTYTVPDPVGGGETDKMSHQLYLVNFVKDKSYLIEMIPGDDAQMIPYLVIEDNKMKVLSQRSGGKNARLTFKAPADGVYRVVATTNGGVGEGDFVLKVSEAKEQDKKPQDVGKGLELKGTLDNSLGMTYDAPDAKGGAKDKMSHVVFLVNFVKGKTYQIDMIGEGGHDPYLFLENAKKKVLDEDDDSGEDGNAQIIFRAPEDGVYRIIATTSGGVGEGNFTLRVVEKK